MLVTDFQAWQPHQCAQAPLSVTGLPSPTLPQNYILGTYAWAVPSESSCRGKWLTSDNREHIWQVLFSPASALRKDLAIKYVLQ